MAPTPTATAAPEYNPTTHPDRFRIILIVAVGVPLLSVVILLCFVLISALRRRRARRSDSLEFDPYLRTCTYPEIVESRRGRMRTLVDKLQRQNRGPAKDDKEPNFGCHFDATLGRHVITYNSKMSSSSNSALAADPAAKGSMPAPPPPALVRPETQ